MPRPIGWSAGVRSRLTFTNISWRPLGSSSRSRAESSPPMISVFELFKIGIGPSSSHTVGPMTAGNRFLDELKAGGANPGRVTAELFGSLAWTGRGHGTDTAICLGLLGERSTSIDPDDVPVLIATLQSTKHVPV